jgi:hypothetical protein
VRLGAGGGSKVIDTARRGGCIGATVAVGEGKGEFDAEELDGSGKGVGEDDADDMRVSTGNGASGRWVPVRTITDPNSLTVDTEVGNADIKASVQACVVSKFSP